jgi:hypothetical protein
MLLQFFEKKGSEINISSGRHNPLSYKQETADQRYAHLTYLKCIDFTFIHKDILLLIESHYSNPEKFGPEHAILVEQIASIIYEVSLLLF